MSRLAHEITAEWFGVTTTKGASEEYFRTQHAQKSITPTSTP